MPTQFTVVGVGYLRGKCAHNEVREREHVDVDDDANERCRILGLQGRALRDRHIPEEHVVRELLAALLQHCASGPTGFYTKLCYLVVNIKRAQFPV